MAMGPVGPEIWDRVPPRTPRRPTAWHRYARPMPPNPSTPKAKATGRPTTARQAAKDIAFHSYFRSKFTKFTSVRIPWQTTAFAGCTFAGLKGSGCFLQQVQTDPMRRPAGVMAWARPEKPIGFCPETRTYVWIVISDGQYAPDFTCRTWPQFLSTWIQSPISRLARAHHGPLSVPNCPGPIGRSGMNAANLPSTVFRAAFAPSPSRLKRSRARRAAAAMSQAKPSLQVVQRADGPFRGHTKSRVCQRRRSEVQMPRVDHQPATGRNSCGSSTPRRIDDFHGQDDNPSPGQPERCEEPSASIQTGLG